MNARKETKPEDATAPTIQPGESSGPTSSAGSLFAEDVENEGESRQQPALTTSTAKAPTTKRKTSNLFATAVTPSKGTKAERLALRAELMKKHKISEGVGPGGKRVFICRGEYSQELFNELRRLEN